MSTTNDPPLERHANTALTGLILMTAGTFALMVQNLRGLIDVLGVGALRVALISLAVAAVLAFIAKVITALMDSFGIADDAAARRALFILTGSVLGSLLAYAVFVATVVVAIRPPIPTPGL